MITDTSDMLIVEQALLAYFSTTTKAELPLLRTSLAETLSSHGKSDAIIERALSSLPFVVISEETVSLVQRKMNRGAANEGASCVLSFSYPNTSLQDETMY